MIFMNVQTKHAVFHGVRTISTMSNKVSSCSSSPWTIFEPNDDSNSYAVVVLNTPINFEEDLALKIIDIWNNALVRITVDGGTNRWLEWLNKTKHLPMSSSSTTPLANPTTVKPPHLITGDMDSIDAQVLKHYKSCPECKVVVTFDQSETDFTKALIELQNYKQSNSLDVQNVLVLCDMSGRFDQTISNINTLYKAHGFLHGSNVYLLSVTSLTWLLKPGVQHTISVPKVLRDEKKCCGLLPIGSKCRVTTTGLKWNLNDDFLEFGRLVSSSNTYDDRSEVVTVLSDNTLTWTMEIDSYLRNEFCLYNNTHCANKL